MVSEVFDSLIEKRSLIAMLMVVAIGGCTSDRKDHSVLIEESQQQTPVPQYGGELNVVTVYRTLSALSWDPADWAWKSSHDTGLVREQLFSADLTKSVRNGGKFPFTAEAYIPQEAMRGELAENWEWEKGEDGSLKLVIQLRKGVMYQAVPGVMRARELDAQDVVFTYQLQNNSPKKIATYFDHIDKVEARDKHTVVFHFNQYHAEWAYRFGYGIYSSIIPRETADIDRKNWRNIVGTGPYRLEKYIHGNSHTYSKNTEYWDSENINGKNYQLPYLEKVRYRIIMDEATAMTALRVGEIDIMETIRWIAVDHLKESTPELQWSRRLYEGGMFVAMRVDTKPFDDVRVRRAMNLAIDQPEMLRVMSGGHAELLAYPEHPEFGDYYQPLEEMPVSVQELFTYNPDKARALLAEAGYPDGFTFTMQLCSCNPSQLELAPLLADYLKKVGVTVEIQPMEYASYLSLMTTRKHSAGYLMDSAHTNPTTTLRKSFGTGQTWNPSQYSDPAFDKKLQKMYLTQDEKARQQLVRDMTVEILDAAPYIWLPTGYVYTAWWPWVKNYHGELRAGGNRPGPIYARIWIDHELKKAMGF